MERNSFFRFLVKGGLFILPLSLILSCYFLCDPYKVIRPYKEYDNNPLILNQTFIGWQTFLNNKDSIHYDSFILGNSCTMAFQTEDWGRYLPGAHPIKLYGNKESIYAIHKKILGLDTCGVSIKNALVLLDHYTLQLISRKGNPLHMLHPSLSEENYLGFQTKMLGTFLNPNILIPYMDYRFFKTYRPSMKGIIGRGEDHRNFLTNDFNNPREEEIAQLSEVYWEKHKREFPNRDGKERVYDPIVKARQIHFLKEIKEVFDRHHTNYRIVLSPEYRQKKIHPQDLKNLEQIFGADCVFNYTGVNKYTTDYHDFYEKSHYRPILGRRIMKEIYGCKESHDLMANESHL